MKLDLISLCDYREDVEYLKAFFSTNYGAFSAILLPQQCPTTTWNFVNLAEGRQQNPHRDGPFYDGLTFHRLIKDFALMGGCPHRTGMGNAGYHFGDDFHPELSHWEMGYLSMGNSGPNSNSCQFFITLGAARHLDDSHNIFGKVTEGLETLEKIAQLETDYNDRPIEPIIIESIVIKRPAELE